MTSWSGVTRITRQRVLQQISQSSEEEVALLVRIEQERAARGSRAAAAAISNDDDDDGNHMMQQDNPFIVGDTVHLINQLRNEYGIVGVVTTSNRRLVTIPRVNKQRIYTLGWWNLEYHRPTSPDRRVIHQAQ